MKPCSVERLATLSDSVRFMGDVCPYCGSSRSDSRFAGKDRLVGGRRDYFVLACQSCGGCFTRGSDFSSLEEYYRIGYPPVYYETLSGGRESYAGSNPAVADVLQRLFAPQERPASILDVGCGNGGFLNRLRGMGFRVTGIEINESAAGYCRNHYGIDVFNGVVEDYRPSLSFDAITMLGTIEHLINPIRTLYSASKLLKDDGYVIFDYPDFGSLESRMAGNRWYGLDLPRHVLHLRWRDVGRVLAAAHISCVERYGDVRTWFHSSFLSPPQKHGVPRRSLKAVGVKALAALFLLTRMKPLKVCVCKLK